MQIQIINGWIIDPGRWDQLGNILIEDGRIVDIQPADASVGKATINDEKRVGRRIIDASGLWITPGLIDMHVHLREPGQEYKETILTGCRAAVAGGFTSVCAMPNTSPVNDNPAITRFMVDQAQKAGLARVYPVAAISQSMSGSDLTDFKLLQEAGAIAFTDDGLPVTNSQLMRRALEKAGELGVPIISHSEDLDLAAGGHMNEGVVSAKMGIKGIPNAAESIGVMRDIALAELTGSKLHLAHISTLESIRAIRDAKERGVSVTAETAPHYFTLTDETVQSMGTNAKMNPPLRSKADRDAVIEALVDGTIDAIATDHAPHSPKEKDQVFDLAPNGIVGLETALPLSLRLVEKGLLSATELVARLFTHPARILGLEPSIKTGMPADLTIIDPQAEWMIRPEAFHSKSKNTPFGGCKVRGKAVMTIVRGRVAHESNH